MVCFSEKKNGYVISSPMFLVNWSRMISDLCYRFLSWHFLPQFHADLKPRIVGGRGEDTWSFALALLLSLCVENLNKGGQRRVCFQSVCDIFSLCGKDGNILLDLVFRCAMACLHEHWNERANLMPLKVHSRKTQWMGYHYNLVKTGAIWSELFIFKAN